MASNNVTPARGMRDFLPQEKANREFALSKIRSTYEQFGFTEIETPVIEELSRLQSGEGGDNEKMLFKILKRGLGDEEPVRASDACDLGLRYDLTLPLARYYASNHSSLPAVFRSVQIAPVWRAERPQKGRFRQFTQCDIDVIGEPSRIAETELVVATLTALEALGVKDTTVRINDRQVLTSMMSACGVPESLIGSALITLDKMDKIGIEGVSDELSDKVGLPEASVSMITEMLSKFAEVDDAQDFDEVQKTLPQEIDKRVIDNLQLIAAGVKMSIPGSRVEFDITLVRGMGYYTGPIFEISHPSTTSSIAGGGRYDKMIGRFMNRAVPACGFSIGFERILSIIELEGQRTDKVALIHGDEVPAESLIPIQTQFATDGKSVRLVKRTKRMASVYDSLVQEGFTHRVDIVSSGSKWAAGDMIGLS